jgi:hypothetical protein
MRREESAYINRGLLSASFWRKGESAFMAAQALFFCICMKALTACLLLPCLDTENCSLPCLSKNTGTNVFNSSIDKSQSIKIRVQIFPGAENFGSITTNKLRREK